MAMPNINTSNIPPAPAPGTLFNTLANDSDLSIRWLTAVDPAFYEIINRPMADIAVRQLVVAKAVDNLTARTGAQYFFPFRINPIVTHGTSVFNVPLGWLYDFSASLPSKWKDLRLKAIERIGETTSTATLRLYLSAADISDATSNNDIIIFYCDYDIYCGLTYQRLELTAASNDIAAIEARFGAGSALPADEAATVSGYVTFATLDLSELANQQFIDFLAEPTGTSPAVYEIAATASGNTVIGRGACVSGSIDNGTGLLTDSAWNSVGNVSSTIQTWLETFNYPYYSDSTLQTEAGLTMPKGMFSQFSVAVPAGDLPSGAATSSQFYPVWIRSVTRTGDTTLLFTLATYSIVDANVNGIPSTTPVDFATFTLITPAAPTTGVTSPGSLIPITPINNLLQKPSAASPNDPSFSQEFGRGQIELSNMWADGYNGDIITFFTLAFNQLATNQSDVFPITAARLSTYGTVRSPKYSPTQGQFYALAGSTARRTTQLTNDPLNPSNDNRFITENDQGLGDRIDFSTTSGILQHNAIDRYGYRGGLAHRVVQLVVDSTSTPNADATFYNNYILPRLRILLGNGGAPRDPRFADYWYNGTRLFFFNGNSWQG